MILVPCAWQLDPSGPRYEKPPAQTSRINCAISQFHCVVSKTLLIFFLFWRLFYVCKHWKVVSILCKRPVIISRILFEGQGCIKCVMKWGIWHICRSREDGRDTCFTPTFTFRFIDVHILETFLGVELSTILLLQSLLCCNTIYFIADSFLQYIIKMLPILRQIRIRVLNLPRASRILASGCTVFFLVCLFNNRNVRGFSQHVLEQHLVSLSPPTNCVVEE